MPMLDLPRPMQPLLKAEDEHQDSIPMPTPCPSPYLQVEATCTCSRGFSLHGGGDARWGYSSLLPPNLQSYHLMCMFIAQPPILLLDVYAYCPITTISQRPLISMEVCFMATLQGLCYSNLVTVLIWLSILLLLACMICHIREADPHSSFVKPKAIKAKALKPSDKAMKPSNKAVKSPSKTVKL